MVRFKSWIAGKQAIRNEKRVKQVLGGKEEINEQEKS